MFILNNIKTISQKLKAKTIAPLIEQMSFMKEVKCEVKLLDTITIKQSWCGDFDLDSINRDIDSVKELAINLKPWRKGPFKINDLHIESEWDSSIKFNTIKPYLNLKNKDVADIGCNNGYYMFKMLEFSPSSITGFDPSALCKCQFDFINHFIKSDIKFEMLGIEDLNIYDKKFDVIVCLGVLYHRTNPIDCLKILKNSLKTNGEIIIDTLMIDSPLDIALSPMRYAKMKNVYFIPSPSTLNIWLQKAGFKDIESIAIMKTNTTEQRKTNWIDTQSLQDFLDKEDSSKTVEGYPAPLRIYIKATR